MIINHVMVDFHPSFQTNPVVNQRTQDSVNRTQRSGIQGPANPLPKAQRIRWRGTFSRWNDTMGVVKLTTHTGSFCPEYPSI